MTLSCRKKRRTRKKKTWPCGLVYNMFGFCGVFALFSHGLVLFTVCLIYEISLRTWLRTSAVSATT